MIKILLKAILYVPFILIAGIGLFIYTLLEKLIKALKLLSIIILCIPLTLIFLPLLFIGIFLDNMYGLLHDYRLPWPARIKWYMFHIAPKTCPTCGDKLKECGYNTRYYCKHCDKDWANKGSF